VVVGVAMVENVIGILVTRIYTVQEAEEEVVFIFLIFTNYILGGRCNGRAKFDDFGGESKRIRFDGMYFQLFSPSTQTY
jgi:hypothetical protein